MKQINRPWMDRNSNNNKSRNGNNSSWDLCRIAKIQQSLQGGHYVDLIGINLTTQQVRIADQTEE